MPTGIEVVAVVVDQDLAERGGLGRALGSIASGDATALLVRRLSATAGSLGELVRLLDWLRDAGADLIATDVELDTGNRAGLRSAALLREVERWGREPDGPRRPLGRPGLATVSPAVGERISALREHGLSLQAIAATLNAEGVATPRGGAQWRPSSVQSALGYRRPRLPVPGAPPPRPPVAGPPPPPPPAPGPPPPPPPVPGAPPPPPPVPGPPPPPPPVPGAPPPPRRPGSRRP